jgi:SAM-dependent methyltransferase
MANEYSSAWQAVFGADRDPAQTAREAAFLARVLPLPGFRRVLDAPCGGGRHARALAQLGYYMVGLDRDPEVVQTAEAAGGGPRYALGDMRKLEPPDTLFDALVCLWASFGYDDHTGNIRQLERFAAAVRPGGRIVLDLYHRGFFDAGPSTRTLEVGDQVIQETRSVEDGRLHVRLRYEDGNTDEFDWQLYEPADLRPMAAEAGCEVMLSCCNWDETRPVDGAQARFQIVLGRVQLGE